MAEQTTTPAGDAEEGGPGVPQIIWRQRWVVVMTLIVAMLAAVAYLLLATPQYTATARLRVQAASIAPATFGPEPTQSLDNSANYLNTEKEVIISTTNLLRVYDKLSNDGRVPVPPADQALDYVRKLKNDVRVEVGKKDDIITVEFDAPSVLQAEEVASAVVNLYRESRTGEKVSSTAKVLEVLKAQRDACEKQVQKKDDEIQDLKKEAGSVSLTDRDQPLLARVIKLNEELSSARLNTLDRKMVYEQADGAFSSSAEHRQRLEALRAVASPRLSGDMEFDKIRSDIQDLERQLQIMARTFMPTHPDYKSLEDRLVVVQASYVLAAEARWKLAQLREKKLDDELKEQQAEATKFIAKVAQYGRLESEKARMERELDALRVRMTQLNADQGAGAMNISVVDKARSDGKITKPARLRTLAVAGLIGLVLGIALGALRDGINPRLHTEDEIKAALGLPVLGVVPHMAGPDSDMARAQTMQANRASVVAEAYRTVRTAIHFRTADRATKTILVTSPTVGDGKSTMASNLAIALAQAGKNILLVDADFRKPSLHRLFQTDDQLGLSSVLQGEASIAEATQRTSIEGLDLLPCGPAPSNPYEMLNDEKFNEVLAQLAQKYDQVILDSAPVMSVSDSRIIGANCDGTLLVLRAARTPRKLSEQACDGLLSVGARILGVVVNDAPQRLSASEYPYGRVTVTAGTPRQTQSTRA